MKIFGSIRVEIEKGVGAVVRADHIKCVPILDSDALHPCGQSVAKLLFFRLHLFGGRPFAVVTKRPVELRRKSMADKTQTAHACSSSLNKSG